MPELHLEPTYEKQLPTEVSSLVWSPKMDLVAFSLVTGEYQYHKLELAQQIRALGILKKKL